MALSIGIQEPTNRANLTRLDYVMWHKKIRLLLGMVAHAYNPSYLGDID
jgi:hypothetical protein